MTADEHAQAASDLLATIEAGGPAGESIGARLEARVELGWKLRLAEAHANVALALQATHPHP